MVCVFQGNIALTDHEDTILNLLRFRKTAGTKEEQAKEEVLTVPVYCLYDTSK